MNQQKNSDDAIQRYLLGSASEAECDEIEHSYLADEGEFERINAAEDDLIEDYLDGRLLSEEKLKFESYFLNAAQRREKLDFASSLRTVVPQVFAAKPTNVPPQHNRWFSIRPTFSWMRWAPSAGLAVAAVGCGLLLFQNRQLSREVGTLRGQQVALPETNSPRSVEPTPSSAEPQETRPLQNPEHHSIVALEPTASSRIIVGAVLSPLLTRSGGSWQRINISPNSLIVELKLSLLDQDFRLYQAILQLAEGKELMSQSHLRPTANRQVIVAVPAALLPRGDYQVILSGETSDGTHNRPASYSFRIIR